MWKETPSLRRRPYALFLYSRVSLVHEDGYRWYWCVKAHSESSVVAADNIASAAAAERTGVVPGTTGTAAALHRTDIAAVVVGRTDVAVGTTDTGAAVVADTTRTAAAVVAGTIRTDVAAAADTSWTDGRRTDSAVALRLR